MEIEYGPFQRQIALADDVDPAARDGDYEHGLLTDRLPVAEQPPGPGQAPIAVDGAHAGAVTRGPRSSRSSTPDETGGRVPGDRCRCCR